MITNLPRLVYHQGLRYPETTAQLSKDEKGVFQPTSYKEMSEQMLNFAGGLKTLGIEKGEHVGHIADNRQEWQIVSLGIMAAGGTDIPRGTDVTTKELAYILGFTKCRIVSVENPYVLGKLCEVLGELPDLKYIILIDDQNQALDKYDLKKSTLFRYSAILKNGEEWRKNHVDEIENNLQEIKEDESATIIFTSGTTGTPKGVELTHKNFLCQLEPLSQRLDFHKADRCLCILPIWHVYQRLLEFYIIYFAGTLCYSKPVSSILLADFQKVRPQIMPCVPRVWESLYQAISKKIKSDSKIAWILFNFFAGCSKGSIQLMDSIKGRTKSFKKRNIFKIFFSKFLYIPYGILFPLRKLGNKIFFQKLKNMVGGQFVCGISGGGGFPAKLDKFFNSIGIQILEGYGLTETAPIVAVRHRYNPVMGTIGKPMPYVETKIIKEDGKIAKPGEKGILYVRGDNVMKGYYHQSELTAKAIDVDGFLNTGDIAIKTYNGELIIKGRQKDTIVLRSGENVEPFPIEAKLSESPYITQAIVVGQDENSLGALIIPCMEAIKNVASQRVKSLSANKNPSDSENTGTGSYSEFNNKEKISIDNDKKLLASNFVQELIRRELERLICGKNGFKNYERVNQFIFLEKFENPKEELSAKGDIIRYKINQNYKHLINTMYHKESKKQKFTEIIQNLIE